jgi:hypothetical protein
VLAALGQPVPEDMTGKVMADFFAAPIDVKKGAPSSVNAQTGETVYSDAEKAIVEQRLADLGYVD